MANNPCSRSALQKAFATDLPPAQVVPNPVLQVLQIKPIAAQTNAPERFRVVLSDTTHFIQAMISTQSNYLVASGELQKGCFIQLSNYNAQKVKDKKILIIIDLKVLTEYTPRDKIGNPTALETSTSGTSAPPAPAPAPVTAHVPAPIAPSGASAASFYGNKPPQPPRQAAPVSRAPAAATNTRHNVYPIESISPYQNKWTIKARVSQKSDIKTWSNTKSEGKLFTVNFLDETGEIRATGFNSEVDSLFETLQEGKVYYISKCRVNMAKKQFSNINNDYELAFSRETEIEECEDDSVPKVNFNFVSLADLANIEKDAIIDVLGVIKEVGELDGIVSKNTGKPYQKRDISIVDSSNSWVRCTIWGASAKTWDHPPDTIVALKGIKVGDYGGKSLSMLNSSSMLANPDIEEAHALRGWYDAEGRRELGTYQSHQGLATMGTNTRGDTKYLNLGEVRDQCLGLNSTEPDYFNTKATIVYIKHENIAYPACSSKDCNKKVIKMDEDSWRCENCNTTHPKPNWRYILNISVNDAFGQAWFSCFDEVSNIIMGKPADVLMEAKERSEMDENKEYESYFSDAICRTFLFRCRAKQDNFQDQTRVRYQVLSAQPLNYAVEAAKLAELIKSYHL